MTPQKLGLALVAFALAAFAGFYLAVSKADASTGDKLSPTDIPGEGAYVWAVNHKALAIYYAAEDFKKNPTEGKKCTADIGAIAYAFARLESGVGSSKKSQLSKNWWSLHPSKTYWKWDGKSKTSLKTGEVLRHYNTVQDAAYDFMGLWKTSYGCSTKYGAVLVYLNGFKKPTGKRLEHAKSYYANFKKYVKEYEDNLLK